MFSKILRLVGDMKPEWNDRKLWLIQTMYEGCPPSPPLVSFCNVYCFKTLLSCYYTSDVMKQMG